MAPLMALALFHSWPWRIPFMAMAHSTHGHGPILFMAMVTGVGGGSGGSLPSIRAIMEHYIYAYV